MVEVDDLVDAVEKLWTQELVEGALCALAALIVHAQAEAERAGARVAAGVRGHDDDRVFKVHGAALRVRDAAVVEDLQQQVHDVRVRLFDLVEEDDGVRAAADLLRELAGLVIADVARGRADHARDGELLHELRHIEPDERLGRVEELVGEALNELRLADAGAADEQEAHGLALGLQADAVAPDGGADGVDGRILADDVRAQPVAETGELLELIGADARGRDLRPELDDAREVIRRELRAALGAQGVELGLQLHLAAAQLGDALVAAVELLLVMLAAGLRRRGGQQLALARVVADLLFDLVRADEVGIFQVHVRAGLVDEVDGLVGQEAVGDIALAEHDGEAAHVVRDDDAVEVLVIAAHALEDLDAVVDARLGHRDGLEAALEGRVFFNVLAVLGERRRADDLDLAA